MFFLIFGMLKIYVIYMLCIFLIFFKEKLEYDCFFNIYLFILILYMEIYIFIVLWCVDI